MEYRDKDFSGEDVLLDGNVFTGCTFRNCRLIFAARDVFQVGACNFNENIKWHFDGPAALTLQFLTAIYHEAGEGGRELVENTFKKIRRGG